MAVKSKLDGESPVVAPQKKVSSKQIQELVAEYDAEKKKEEDALTATVVSLTMDMRELKAKVKELEAAKKTLEERPSVVEVERLWRVKLELTEMEVQSLKQKNLVLVKENDMLQGMVDRCEGAEIRYKENVLRIEEQLRSRFEDTLGTIKETLNSTYPSCI